MKYKIGDRVRIKSLDWYNENKDEDGIVELSSYVFAPGMSQFCGKVMTIEDVFEDVEDNAVYYMKEIDYDWTDGMIEGLAEEETKPNVIEEAKTYWDSIKDAWICPEGYQFVDENGNVINARKIVLEKKSPKTDDIIKWLREHDMTKYIGILYTGLCSVTFDTEKLIKDITEVIGDE